MSESNRKTILVVDDDPHLRDLTETLVRGHGYECLLAESGPAAVELARSHQELHLLILDLMMPGMDGYETLSRLRDLGHQKLPVIILTARSNDEELLRGYSVGADFYLVKPFRNSTLIRTVDYLIGDLSAEEKAAIEREL